jgi:hypothetical protein
MTGPIVGDDAIIRNQYAQRLAVPYHAAQREWVGAVLDQLRNF